MKWQLVLPCLALAAMAILLLSCMSPQQQSEALSAIEEWRRNGSITEAQYDAFKEAIMGSGISQFWQLLLGNVLGSVATYGAVQMRRGPVATLAERQKRKGA